MDQSVDAKPESSEPPSPSPESTTISLSKWRIKRLGGRRNAEDYTIARLTKTPTIKRAIEIIEPLNIGSDNLYIHGPTGSGKTHLAVAVAQRFSGAWVVKPTQILRQCRGSEAREEQSVITEYVETPVLIIDDLGIQKDTEFATTVLYEIIDGRYADKRGGLIVTSNLSLGDLSTKIGDDRIASRLAQMCRIISLEGAMDHRVYPAKLIP